MNVKWLLERDIFDEDLLPILMAVKEQGMEHRIVTYIPFEGGHYNQYPCEDCVVCYGSLNLMDHLQKNKKWLPGIYMNLPNFECTKYYTYFGKYLLNSDYFMMPLAEMQRRAQELAESFDNDKFFVRPSSGFKSFTGEVLTIDDWDNKMFWINEFTGKDEMVVVTSPKKVTVEYRFIVADKTVITGSRYGTGREGSLRKKEFSLCVKDWEPSRVETVHPQEAWDLAQTIASEDWEPDRLYVIDIGECEGQMHLIEINSFSASGWYACDPRIIVEAAAKITLEEWQNRNAL